MNACFSEFEARDQLGAEVEAAADLPDVPRGTRGRVVGAHARRARGWTVQVKWDLPDKRSEIFAQIFDFSFNLPWKTRRPLGDFGKSDLGPRFRLL
jgi:hypothetical protein